LRSGGGGGGCWREGGREGEREGLDRSPGSRDKIRRDFPKLGSQNVVGI